MQGFPRPPSLHKFQILPTVIVVNRFPSGAGRRVSRAVLNRDFHREGSDIAEADIPIKAINPILGGEIRLPVGDNVRDLTRTDSRMGRNTGGHHDVLIEISRVWTESN